MHIKEIHEMAYSRRSLLRGVGAGALLMAPLLRSINAFAATGTVPLRLLILTHYHGWLNFEDVPTGTSPALPAAYSGLNAVKDQVLFLKGLQGNTMWGNAHDDAPAALLTANVRPNTTGAKPDGVSLDRFLNANLSSSKSLDPQYFSVYGDGYANNNYCWENINGNLNSISFLSDLESFFNRVAGQAPSGSNGNSATPAADAVKLRRKSVLDGVKDDIALVRGRLPADQRGQLDLQLSAIAAAEKNLALNSNENASPTTTASCAAPAAILDGSYASRMRSALNLYKTMINCNMNQVLGVLNMPAPGIADFSWQYPAGVDRGHNLPLPAPGNTRTDFHDVVGHWSTQEQHATYLAMLKLMVDEVGSFATSLASSTDLDGKSVLDNTLIMLTGVISDGHHEQARKTVTLIGGRGAGIVSGRGVALPLVSTNGVMRMFKNESYRIETYGFRDFGSYTEADLYVSIARLMGLTNTLKFGDAGVNTTPLVIAS